MDHHSECYGSDSKLRRVGPRCNSQKQLPSSGTQNQRRIWSKQLLTAALRRPKVFFILFRFVQKGRRGSWTATGVQLSRARSAICVYASFVYLHIDLEFLDWQNTLVLWLCLVWFGLVFEFFFFCFFATHCAVFLLAKSICIQQRIHLASFYLQHKQLHNCYAAIEFEFIGQAFSLRAPRTTK